MVIFNSFLYVYQRVTQKFHWFNQQTWWFHAGYHGTWSREATFSDIELWDAKETTYLRPWPCKIYSKIIQTYQNIVSLMDICFGRCGRLDPDQISAAWRGGQPPLLMDSGMGFANVAFYHWWIGWKEHSPGQKMPEDGKQWVPVMFPQNWTNVIS